MAELKLRKNEKGMILAIDMGNTNIVIGCVDDKKVLFEERLSTDYSKTELEYAIGFKTVLEIYNINSDDIKGAIISSVVPQLVNIIKAAVEKTVGITPLMVGPGIKTWHGTQHVGRHVGDTADETHFESGGGKLLGTRTRPESVFQKVVLDRRQRLDGAVAAVVVRQQQPLGRDHLARTSRAEDDDRIFERRTVGGINLLGREFAPLGPHVGDIHLLQIGQQPHSLVGGRRRGEECREQKHRKFFHRY